MTRPAMTGRINEKGVDIDCQYIFLVEPLVQPLFSRRLLRVICWGVTYCKLHTAQATVFVDAGDPVLYLEM